MSNVLTDLSEKPLSKAIHESWNSCMYKYFGNNPDTYYRETPELKIIDNNLKISMFNRVYHTNLEPHTVEQKIVEIIKHFNARKLPFNWQVDPDDKPSNLAMKLEEAGLERTETPGMAILLEDLAEPKIPEGFRWEKVETKEKLVEWSYLLCKAYGMPEFGWDKLAQAVIRLGVLDDFPCYTGYYRDKPVATSAVFYSEGVAGLYDVASLPDARGKGVGSMITYVPFIEAVDRGYKIGILHSSKMGYNVYKRLGFEDICQLVRYEWTPKD